MRSWIYLGVLIMGFGGSPPGHCQGLPGVMFEDASAAGVESLRLIVGGPEQHCLSWSWRDPKPGIDLYPIASAGTFLGSDAAWTLNAGGETTSVPCHPAEAFPSLGLGPANELWLLAPVDEPALSTEWADLLDAVEAIYRQSTASPLAATTIGSLEGCAVRSLPVPLDTRLDRWSPVELPGRAGPESADAPSGDHDPMIRARRFQWWIEPATPGEACSAGGSTGTLRLFPVPTDTTAGDEGAGNISETDRPPHLLTLAGVTWQTLSYFAFDPDDWSPHLRRLAQAIPSSHVTAAPDIETRTRPEQRRRLGIGELDLCQVEGIAALCARNALARQQLYTAVPRQDSETPWPEERVLETREACQNVLGRFVPAGGPVAGQTPCAEAELWQRPLAGDLVQGFSGEVLIARQPAILETWHDGIVEWRLESGDDPRKALAATPMLDISLLNGDRVRVATRDLLEAARQPTAPSWPWLALLTAALALGILAGTVLLARRRDSPATATSVTSEDQLRPLVRRLVAEEVEHRLGGGTIEQTHLTEQQFNDLARDLSEEFQQRFTTLGDELRGSLHREARSLSEGLRQDVEARATPFERLRRELDELPACEREPLTATLEAAGRLGDWIERLWPVLQAASGTDVESIAGHLPDAAADEWRRAAQALHAFSRADAIGLRRLAHGSNGAGPSLDPAEIVFLEHADLLPNERPVAERLKRYLEPFDHLGRLGEVTLALQYLVEAYPIEQLAKDRRSVWRRELAKAQRLDGQDEDFHHLVAQIAAGVGLRYCPVRYYKSRTDQADVAFVRQQVSPISLSERVGFEATADKEVIVRLERPFFFQLSTNIYFAGHAHVARG